MSVPTLSRLVEGLGRGRKRPRSRWWSFTWPSLAVAGGLGALELIRGFYQHRQTFAPDRYPEGAWEPDAVGLPLEDRWFETEDGVRLHGWWIPRRRSRCVILYCHGNTGSLGSQSATLGRFRDRLKASIFAFDYRGYGRSEGSPREKGLYRDVRAAYHHLTEELGQEPGRIVLFGHSLGGAVAIDAALRVPVAGLVAQATFTQIRDMARTIVPGMPLHWIARNRFRSIEKVGDLDLPKLFVHGARDLSVPQELGRCLYEAASEPKGQLILPRAGHNDILEKGGVRYWFRLMWFCRRCVRRAG